jgi:hypothetical protein
MAYILGTLILYSLVGFIVTAPVVWYGRQRAPWSKSDILMGVTPLFIYIGVRTIAPAKGGANNFLVESALMALILPIASVALLLSKNQYQRSVVRALFILGAVVTAFGLILFIPEMQD